MMAKYCRACRFYIFGTLGSGRCNRTQELKAPKAEACIHIVGRYHGGRRKLKATKLDWMI